MNNWDERTHVRVVVGPDLSLGTLEVIANRMATEGSYITATYEDRVVVLDYSTFNNDECTMIYRTIGVLLDHMDNVAIEDQPDISEVTDYKTHVGGEQVHLKRYRYRYIIGAMEYEVHYFTI